MATAALVVGLSAGMGGALVPAPASAAPAKCSLPSLNKQIKQADVVFRGVVDKVRPVKGKGTHRTRTYKVTADRVYQASLVADSVVVTAPVGTACPLPTLKQGKRYLFFVTENASRLMATSSTAKATSGLTAKIVAKLGDGVPAKTSHPADASFTMVADASPPALSRLLAPGAALVIVSLLGLLVVGRLARRTSP
ncbi:MAG: hypothetical protein QM747_21870 [Nocardioides sp.]